jgi:serine/threonine-protein kinase
VAAPRDDGGDDVANAETMVSGERRISANVEPLPLDSEPGRYQLIELLGRGGMGEVYKAYDPQLGRHVALKIMRDTGPQLAASLVSEARAQARVEHANVCKVYGVGELNGRPFIALQYIEGKTLREAAMDMSREQRIRVLLKVADALHAAHRQGLVHRDVKPSNILVEKTEKGWHPYVTDFGIARLVDAPGLTKTGTATGTPLYMAPEQARGGETHRIDRRTDVYALGVTLYELLSGKRPFEGDTSLSVILKVLHEEPVPLRSVEPSVPVDLETVTMKCIEKDPARRYDSARALAEDLQCWLDGEPIHARRSSLGYRLAKRARKHIALLSALTLVLVAGVTLAAYAWHARRMAGEQARLAHTFGQEVERNDAIARYAAMLPLHDTRRERSIIEQRMADLETRIHQLGTVAEGPGRYALGRGWLMLDRPEDARRELERAWQSGYRAPEVSYALGVALAQLYQAALAVPQRAGDPELQQKRRAELETSLRDPALQHLKAASELQLEAPEYVEGLIALYEGRYAIALEKARAAQARVPWMYEAHTLEGDIHYTAAKDRSNKDPQAALAELERAGEAYRGAVEIAHSSARALQGECRRWVLAAEILGDLDRSPADCAETAVRVCGQALVARPGMVDVYADEVDALIKLANYNLGHNADPLADWDRAARLADDALKANPNDVRALLAVGRVEKARANYGAEHGEDPRPRVEHVARVTAAALAREPNSFDAHLLASDMGLTRGDWESGHGIDPRKSYDAAAEAGRQAIAIAPNAFKTHNTLGLAYLDKGIWEGISGLDPTEDLMQAVRNYEKVVEVSPNVDYGYANLCVTWQTLAEYQLLKRVDPMPALKKSLAACEKATAIDPNWAGTPLNAACVHKDMAAWLRQANLDPTAELTQARAGIKVALAIDHTYPDGYHTLGDIELLAARWAADHGQNQAAALFETSRKQLEHALDLNSNDADTLRGLAEMHRWRAAWRESRHERADEDIRAGLSRSAQALAINPRLGAAAMQEAALHLLAAHAVTGDARKHEIESARATLAHALSLNANLDREAKPISDELAKLGSL